MGSWGCEGGVCSIMFGGGKPGATQSTVFPNCVPVLGGREREAA